MFLNAKHFNQPIGDWDVSNVIEMSCMFEKAIAFNQDLSKWNPANSEIIYYMFDKVHNFDYNNNINDAMKSKMIN
jgi:surface protein